MKRWLAIPTLRTVSSRAPAHSVSDASWFPATNTIGPSG